MSASVDSVSAILPGLNNFKDRVNNYQLFIHTINSLNSEEVTLDPSDEYYDEDMKERGIVLAKGETLDVSTFSEDELTLFRIERGIDLLRTEVMNKIIRWEHVPINMVQDMKDYLSSTKQKIKLNPEISVLVTSKDNNLKKAEDLYQFSTSDALGQPFEEIRTIMNSARFELLCPFLEEGQTILHQYLQRLSTLKVRPKFQAFLSKQISLAQDALSSNLFYSIPPVYQNSFQSHLKRIREQATAGDILHITIGSGFKLNPKELFPFDIQKGKVVLRERGKTIAQGNRCWSIHIDPGFLDKDLPVFKTPSGKVLKPREEKEKNEKKEERDDKPRGMVYTFGDKITAFITPLCFDYLHRDLSNHWRKISDGKIFFAYLPPSMLESFAKQGLTVCLGLHVFDSEMENRTIQHQYEALCREYPERFILFHGSCQLPFQIAPFSKELLPKDPDGDAALSEKPEAGYRLLPWFNTKALVLTSAAALGVTVGAAIIRANGKKY